MSGQQDVPRKWIWRRALTFSVSTCLAIIAGIAVWRAPDPQLIGIASIVGLWLVSLQYVIGATAEDVTRITAAVSEGMKRAQE